MGRSIGSLGRKREPLDLEFDYFGSKIRVNPHATDAVEIEFLEAGRDVDVEGLADLDLSDLEALKPEDQARLLTAASRSVTAGFKATMTALHDLIHPDDFATYWRLAKENGQQVSDLWADIRALTGAVVEATTDFPIGRRSGSPDGSPRTPDSSAVGSPSPDLLSGSDLHQALALERGRPDIQEFYVMQHEERIRVQREAIEAERRDREKLHEAGII